jgi:pimeloyl-ACP methyl ester carboxylesterase
LPLVAFGGEESGVSRIVDDLDESKLHVVNVAGIPTRYYEAGSGIPVVFLHGGHFGFVDSLDTWSLNLEDLAQTYHVYALDRPGQGHTGAPLSDDDYTQEATLRHALAWLDAVGLSGAYLVGHSRGGFLAAQIALERPGLPLGLVVISSATLAPEAEDPAFACGAYMSSLLDTHQGEWTAEDLRVEPEANFVHKEYITDEYIGRYLTMVRLPSFREAEAKMRAGLADSVFFPSLNLARKKSLEVIDEQGLPCRTLIVWSADDRAAPVAEIGYPLYDRVRARTKDADLHVFNRAGHYPYREYPVQFGALLRAFISSAD